MSNPARLNILIADDHRDVREALRLLLKAEGVDSAAADGPRAALDALRKQRFNAALAERRFPGREVADGLLIAVGGTLLLTPGFVTDILGAIFLIPPTRAIVRRLLRGYMGKRFAVVGVGSMGGTPSNGHAGRSYDYDATAEEIDSDDPRLPG